MSQAAIFFVIYFDGTGAAPLGRTNPPPTPKASEEKLADLCARIFCDDSRIPIQAGVGEDYSCDACLAFVPSRCRRWRWHARLVTTLVPSAGARLSCPTLGPRPGASALSLSRRPPRRNKGKQETFGYELHTAVEVR